MVAAISSCAESLADPEWASLVQVLLADRHLADEDFDVRAALGVTRARVLGSVPPETVRNAFHGGVYLNPTTAAEGFQLTLIEAAAAGASIVTYAVGGTDELADLPGTDIVIIAKGDEKGLAAATWAALNRRPPSPELSALSAWDWTSVANEYVSVLRSV